LHVKLSKQRLQQDEKLPIVAGASWVLDKELQTFYYWDALTDRTWRLPDKATLLDIYAGNETDKDASNKQKLAMRKQQIMRSLPAIPEQTACNLIPNAMIKPLTRSQQEDKLWNELQTMIMQTSTGWEFDAEELQQFLQDHDSFDWHASIDYWLENRYLVHEDALFLVDALERQAELQSALELDFLRQAQTQQGKRRRRKLRREQARTVSAHRSTAAVRRYWVPFIRQPRVFELLEMDFDSTSNAFKMIVRNLKAGPSTAHEARVWSRRLFSSKGLKRIAAAAFNCELGRVPAAEAICIKCKFVRVVTAYSTEEERAVFSCGSDIQVTPAFNCSKPADERLPHTWSCCATTGDPLHLTCRHYVDTWVPKISGRSYMR
jgi:hypothetical protein